MMSDELVIGGIGNWELGDWELGIGELGDWELGIRVSLGGI